MLQDTKDIQLIYVPQGDLEKPCVLQFKGKPKEISNIKKFVKAMQCIKTCKSIIDQHVTYAYIIRLFL